MTQTIRFIRRFILRHSKGNPVSMVAIFVLPLVAAFLFISIQSVRGAGTVIWDMEPDQGTTSAYIVGRNAGSQDIAGYFETGVDSVSEITMEIVAYRNNNPGDLTMQVWTDNGGIPGSLVPGWTISVPNNEFTTNSNGALETFVIEGDTLATNTPYWVVFDPDGVDSGNYYGIRRRAGSNPYPATWAYGIAIFDGSSWVYANTAQFAWKMTAEVEFGPPLPEVANSKQYKSDGSTEIGEGQTTNESTVVFKANIQNISGDPVRWQIELRELEEGFLNTYDPMYGGFLQTDPVDAATPTPVEITRPALTNGDYHWQYRAYVDATGTASDWIRYETDDANPDFIVQATQEIKVAVILAEPDGSQFQQYRGPLPYRDHFGLLAEQTRDYWCEVSFGSRATPSDSCVGGLIELDIKIFPEGGGAYPLPDRDSNTSNNDATDYYGKDFTFLGLQLGIKKNYDIGTDGFGITFDTTSKDKGPQYAWDSINKAYEDLDFNEYQVVVTIHPGDSSQGGGGSSAMLTFFTGFERAPENNSSEIAKRWIVASENERVGTWAHELGHAIGHYLNNGVFLCDIYSTKGYGCGKIGDWGLMGFGSGLGESKGSNPAHLSSYSKEALGWLGEDFVGLGTHTIESVETQEEGDKIVKHKVSAGDDRYYQLEARSQSHTKWGTGIPKDALLIYRVRSSTESIWTEHGYVQANRPTINLLEALGVGDDPLKDMRNGRLFDVDSFTSGSEEFSASGVIQEYSSTNYKILAMDPARLIYDQAYEVIVPQETGAPYRYGVNPVEAQVGEAGAPPARGTTEYLWLLAWELSFEVLLAFVALWYSYALFAIVVAGITFGILLILRRRGRDVKQSLVRVASTLFGIALIYGALFMIFGRGIVPESVEFELQDWYGELGSTPMETIPVVYAPSEDAVGPDLDLHAYDEQGNHVGMNYETGLYEINIPGAEASGELVYDEEWIAIPDGVNVTYEVASDDLTEFIEQNPYFASELASTSEEYSIQAITYDAASQRYESAPVENITINPGETRVHTIGGTTEAPTVDEGVVVVELDAISDTYLKKGHPNKNLGDELTTFIRGSGNRSPLVQFDQQTIVDAVGTGTLLSATLEMTTVDGTASSWTSNGKLVGPYRLTHPWTELGATWNCGNDIDTSNSSPDCDGETWEMNQSSAFSWLEPPLEQVLFTNDTTGTIQWDVMSDVQAFLAGTNNYGWVVRKDKDGAQGRIEFSSRETPTPPKLILEFVR